MLKLQYPHALLLHIHAPPPIIASRTETRFASAPHDGARTSRVGIPGARPRSTKTKSIVFNLWRRFYPPDVAPTETPYKPLRLIAAATKKVTCVSGGNDETTTNVRHTCLQVKYDSHSIKDAYKQTQSCAVFFFFRFSQTTGVATTCDDTTFRNHLSEVLLSAAERQAEGSFVLRVLQRARYGKRHR